MILVTPKQEVERKSEWFCGLNSKFKVEWENGIWTKIRFLASGCLFTCGNFTLLFTVFSIFGSDFFLNSYPNPFIVYSRPSFLFEPNFHFSLIIFSSRAVFRHFVFFLLFWSDFSRNRFPNSLIVRSRSSFLFSQWNFFEFYVRTCPVMFYDLFTPIHDFWSQIVVILVLPKREVGRKSKWFCGVKFFRYNFKVE